MLIADTNSPGSLNPIGVFISVGIGIAFGLLRRAARLDPIEALRYE